MKNIKYYIIAAVCGLLTACQNGDWDEPNLTTPPYGNNNIVEDASKQMTIDAFLKKYKDYLFEDQDKITEITEDIQIKGWVVGNDIGGNIYKKIYIQDDTRALEISVNQSGMNGILPIGQEVLIDLKGLHVGGYRKMPQIGIPYGTSIGRMSQDLFAKHFKILQNYDPNHIQPVDFETIKGDKNTNCGKLVILKNVTFDDADGENTFAPQGENYTSRKIGMGSNVVVRTSSYARFAGDKLPTTPCDIIGIASRYNNDWQIEIRKTDDVIVK